MPLDGGPLQSRGMDVPGASGSGSAPLRSFERNPFEGCPCVGEFAFLDSRRLFLLNPNLKGVSHDDVS